MQILPTMTRCLNLGQKQKLLRFKLTQSTTQALEETSQRTHITKSELVRLAIRHSLPHASQLNLKSHKGIGATAYWNVYVNDATYQTIKDLAEDEPSAKLASVVRALVEYAVATDNYIPISD